MPMSPYFRQLRSKVGHGLLLVPGVAAVIRDPQGRILLQERSSGEGWSLPAGAIEPGERPEDAVRREVREETGIVVDPTEILGVYGGAEFRYTYPNGDAVEYTVVLYRCTPVETLEGPIDGETKSLRYFAESKMPTLCLPYPRSALFGGGDRK
jgi:8-oxo-dGTP pyrophosphatase MutT (NUDIX family)